MTANVEAALARWGMADATCVFVARRENEIWQLQNGKQNYALRFHRPGYRTDAELRSELDWMAALKNAGLSVPQPVASQSGNFMETIDGVQIDMLSWLAGAPMGKTGQPLQHRDREGLFRSIGKQAALLHTASDEWALPVGFDRCHWNIDGLLGEKPLWGRFWENPALNKEDQKTLTQFRTLAREHLEALGTSIDYGLIHADMVRENLMVDNGEIQIIDFDDGGFGYRQFELATILIKNLKEPDYTLLHDALLEGYGSVRNLDTTHLNLFLALRAATYVGWIISRFDEEGAPERNQRFIGTCMPLVRSWMAE